MASGLPEYVSQRSAAQRVMFLTMSKAQFDQHTDAVLRGGTYSVGGCGCAFCWEYRQEREIQELEDLRLMPEWEDDRG